MTLRQRWLVLIQEAAARLGVSLRPDAKTLPCFDDSLLLGPQPARGTNRVALLCDHLGGIAVAASDAGLEVVRTDPEDQRMAAAVLPTAAVVVLDTRHHGEDEFALCTAWGCRVAGAGGVWHAPAMLILSGDPALAAAEILEAAREAPHARVRSRDLKAGIGMYGGPLVEETRRWALGRRTASLAAVCDSTLDIERFKRHCAEVTAAVDNYMWFGERFLMYALVSSLVVEGAIIEIGVGAGGTFSVLVAFAPGERHRYAYETYGYGGAEQRVEFEATMAPWRERYLLMEHPSAHAGLREPIAFLHVDGAHDYEDVRSDLERFATQVIQGGVLACDDYLTRRDQPGVGRAVDEFIARGGWVPIAAGPKCGWWRHV